MDIFELLTKDHRLAMSHLDQLDLIKDFKGNDAARDDLFNRLKQELEVHMRSEERVFYPVFLDDEPLRHRILQAGEEHRIIKGLLNEMTGAPRDEHWNAMLAVLMTNLGRHIEKEETVIYLRAQEILSGEQRSELGALMVESKNEERVALRSGYPAGIRQGD